MGITQPAAADNVCEIVGGAQYATLSEALDAVQDGQTIRLLADIDYNSGIEIENESITFDLAGYTLEVVDTSDGGAGLWVMNGTVAYVDNTGLGEFNVTGDDAGVQAMDNGTATVTNATATGEEGCGALADGGSAVVNGDAISTGGYGCGALAEFGGSVHVAGNALGKWCGVYTGENGYARSTATQRAKSTAHMPMAVPQPPSLKSAVMPHQPQS